MNAGNLSVRCEMCRAVVEWGLESHSIGPLLRTVGVGWGWVGGGGCGWVGEQVDSDWCGS